ncbi:MAG: hypothetical protein HOE90_11250 [Bacteriovoracaceae bacterium]|nr:hypothetical protein [Bacteriovoracaceae bacterium]
MISIEKIKKYPWEKIALALCLAVLVIIRLRMYLLKGPSILGVDGEVRYLPSINWLETDVLNFFRLTGPTYVCFLFFLKKITSAKLFFLSVSIFQHLFGLISAVLSYLFLRSYNKVFALVITFYLFSREARLILEHSVMRESLCVLIFSLLLYLFFRKESIARYKKNELLFAICFGLMGLALKMTRGEYIVVFLSLPVVFTILNRKYFLSEKLKAIKLSSIYFLPFVIYLVLKSILLPMQDQKNISQKAPYSGSTFNIAYHSMKPEVFYYKNSAYPELLNGYQKVLDKNKKVGLSMGAFYKLTQAYLKKHPELKMGYIKMMDKIYLEMVMKNTWVYSKALLSNFYIMTLGNENAVGFGLGRPLKWNRFLLNLMERISFTTEKFIGIKTVNTWAFYLFIISSLLLVFFFKKYPIEIQTGFFISWIHLITLGVFANPVYRFRMPLDIGYYSFSFFGLFVITCAITSLIKRRFGGKNLKPIAG